MGFVGLHMPEPQVRQILSGYIAAAGGGERFGVNLTLIADQTRRLEAALDAGCCVVSLWQGDPAPYARRAKDAGLRPLGVDGGRLGGGPALRRRLGRAGARGGAGRRHPGADRGRGESRAAASHTPVSRTPAPVAAAWSSTILADTAGRPCRKTRPIYSGPVRAGLVPDTGTKLPAPDRAAVVLYSSLPARRVARADLQSIALRQLVSTSPYCFSICE